MNKKVKRIVKAQDVMMGEIGLKQPLPTGSIDMVDPFLLLHHMGPIRQAAGEQSVLPVGPHPHRGFEPVTFVFKGSVHHRDSRDNNSIIHTGGVQWMTAGMGIIHSEMLPKEFIEKGGDLEIIQLWINLPSQQKFNQPRYQGFQSSEIPKFEGQGVTLNVISGSYNEISGPVDSLTNITAYTIQMDKGSQIDIPTVANNNPLIYQLDGTVICNNIECGPNKMITFEDEGNRISLNANEESTLLYVSGEPINEKVVKWGPYVMNSQTEIMEAMRDYQMGKMGILI